jgi:glycosyltransferase involved in cell wall biosynthesis
MTFSVCAIMSTFNEEDIIEETISKLIQNDISVYLLDNKSTDKTVEKAKRFLGHGLINIESVVYHENGKEVFSLRQLMRKKEEVSRKLDYDWFINVDADEIRLSPWPNINLRNAIKIVDDLGYNLINFRLLNFRLTNLDRESNEVEVRMRYFDEAEHFNNLQVRAWKKADSVNLVDTGGHSTSVKNPKLFPLRFILKHYPIRSLQQGTKKVIDERIARFSKEEKNQKWHVQYDHHALDPLKIQDELISNVKLLKIFDHNEVYTELSVECVKALKILHEISNVSLGTVESCDLGSLPATNATACALRDITTDIYKKLLDGTPIDLNYVEPILFPIKRLLKKQALSGFFKGNTSLLNRLDLIEIIACADPETNTQQSVSSKAQK